MRISNCKFCGAKIKRHGKPGIFCSLDCKAESQMLAKPVSREYLVDLYVNKKMGANAIAKIVGRNPKQVWNWLVGFGIKTRKRGWKVGYVVRTRRGAIVSSEHRSFHDREWLEREYRQNGRSASDIAVQFGVSESAIFHHLEMNGIKRRTIAEARKIKKWGLSGSSNGMFGKRGSKNPNWRGGSTPERQAFYSSIEWRRAVRKIRKRDKCTCQRCGSKKELEIHHIAPFSVKELRSELTNLVMLCETCHIFVHSKKNSKKEFIA